MTSLRNVLFASVIAAGAFAATSASATQVFLNNVGYYSNQKVQVTGPGFNKLEVSTALKLTLNNGVGPSLPQYTLWGFCVDLFHNLDAGFGFQKPVNLQYHTAEVDNDSNGHALSLNQTHQIYGLAKLGYHMVKNNVSDLQNKLSAVQAAIWQIEYSPFGYSVTSAIPTQAAYQAAYVAQAPGLSWEGAYGLYSNDGRHQGLVVGVPEPATWAMMIMGFGLVGMTLRSSRRRPVAA